MEEGLSVQTKIGLIKNEREERSLTARLEKISVAKAVWAHNSECDKKLFIKTHSRLISRALETSQAISKEQNSPPRYSPKLCRWKHKTFVFKNLSFTSLISDIVQPETHRNHSYLTDDPEKFQINTMKETEEIHDTTVRNDEPAEQSTENQMTPKENFENGNVINALSETPNGNSDTVAHEGVSTTEEDQMTVPDETNKVRNTENTAVSDDESLEHPIKNKFENETPFKIAMGQTFITDLGLIEEENANIMLESDTELPQKAFPVIRPVPNTQLVRRRSLAKPTLSPITDKSEDTERNMLNHCDDVLSDKTSPQYSGELSTEEEEDDKEGEDVDSEDGCIEQVRMSNDLSSDLSNSNTEEEKEVLPSDSDPSVNKTDGETSPIISPRTEVSRNEDMLTFELENKQVKKKNVKSAVSKTKPRKSLTARQDFLVSRTSLLQRPTAQQLSLHKPVCRRYEQAMIPSAFNIDFLTRIIKKNAKHNSDDEDDDEVNEYSMLSLHKKKPKRKATMSPGKPRVIWTQEKIASLPDCRYLRLPPLVQVGQAF